MRPVATTFAGVVPAPIEKVFELLTDPARMPHWLPGCRSAKANGPGPLRKGSRLSMTFAKRATTLEIIEFSAPPPSPGPIATSAPARKPTSSCNSAAAPPSSPCATCGRR